MFAGTQTATVKIVVIKFNYSSTSTDLANLYL